MNFAIIHSFQNSFSTEMGVERSTLPTMKPNQLIRRAKRMPCLARAVHQGAARIENGYGMPDMTICIELNPILFYDYTITS